MDDPSPRPALSDQPKDAVFLTQERKGSDNQRDRPKRLAIKLLPGQVAFRFLILVSAAGRLLCNNGAVVSRIRRETATRIHCEAAEPGSNLRVVLVVGSRSREGREVSSAQEAIVKVFESVWEVEEGGGCKVWWKMLAHTSQVGAVMGRGGKNIRRVRTESGAQIRILPAPHWTAKNDELIQITGGFLAVKKALVDVSNSLHDCPPFDKAPTPITRSLGDSPCGASTESQAELSPHVSSPLPPHSAENTGISASHGDTSSLSLSIHAKRVVSGQDKKGTQQQEVVFRMLCSYHAAGWVIGKKGALVKALQNEAGASIMFAAPLTEFGERVVTISAWENLESSHSPAQNAVVLVFARMIEGVIERGSLSGLSEGRPVTAKLLVVSDLVGSLGGNEGKVLSEMREVTGADMQILEEEHILNCGSVNDALVQITGEYKSVENALFQVTSILRDNHLRAKYPFVRVSEDPLRNDPVPHNRGAVSSSSRLQPPQIAGGTSAVKKALIDVSTCLQDCPPSHKSPTPLTRPLGVSSCGSSPDPHAEFFPHLSSPLPPLPGNSGNSASKGNTSSLPIHADVVVSGQDKNSTEQEVVFRMLCSNHAAGCVIGKRGAIVRALQQESCASISFSAPLTESGERVLTISAWENLESSCSAAQNAVGCVFARIMGGFIEKGFLSGLSVGQAVTAKLLVASDFVGRLSGNDGKLLSEMREITGADIRILEREQILNRASVSDVVVQITGEYESVRNALFQVTGSIRDHLLLSEVFKEMRVKSPYLRLSEDPLRNEHVPHNIGALSSPPRLRLTQTVGRGKTTAISDSERGLTTFGGDLELGSGNKLATVTAISVEIVIPEHVFDSVYGEDGSNLDRIIQISGAKVEVHDPCPGEREGKVIISGAPDKTFAAQSLLQAFIQSAGKTPYH